MLFSFQSVVVVNMLCTITFEYKHLVTLSEKIIESNTLILEKFSSFCILSWYQIGDQRPVASAIVKPSLKLMIDLTKELSSSIFFLSNIRNLISICLNSTNYILWKF